MSDLQANAQACTRAIHNCTKANVYVWHLISWWYGEEQHRWPTIWLIRLQLMPPAEGANGRIASTEPVSSDSFGRIIRKFVDHRPALSPETQSGGMELKWLSAPQLARINRTGGNRLQ
ncbi:hypothetical protein T10_12850 [Trichinella papuae]|uniref:Uncharacterized protein n=1 Tax=Trichinella papuae TaxID=268474 RepID=A0A0V1MMX8_9BILA|nr:hypothetical protein T10_12850 [Trichinella papuae]